MKLPLTIMTAHLEQSWFRRRGVGMHNLRVTTIVTAMTSSVATALWLISRHAGWSIDEQIVIYIALLTGVAALALACTCRVVDAISESRTELRVQLLEDVRAETDALQRSLATSMEQYGDSRAIAAHVSAERRRAQDERSGAKTVDLNQSSQASPSNVTNLRRRG